MKFILETERLLLREFVREDLNDFFSLVSDPEVTRYTHDGGKTLDEVRTGMEERMFRDYKEHGYGRWAMIFKPTGQLIGFAGLKYLPDLGEVDLGYRLMKAYWGQGLATEASKALLAYGFDVLRLPRIIGMADAENKASIRVLEKVGFRFEKLTTEKDYQIAWYVAERGVSSRD